MTECDFTVHPMARCENCNSLFYRSHGEIVKVQGKTLYFCSEHCANSYMLDWLAKDND